MATKTKKPTTDDLTLQLIAQVAKQKAEISKAERSAYITNCSFSYTEKASDALNLHVQNDVKALICIAAFLKDKERSYKEATELLGVADAPSFTWHGFLVNDWIEDLKIRITKVQIAKKKQKLEALETRLNAIISPELKAQMELEAIAKALV